MELMDKFGTRISATLFNQSIYKYGNMLKEGSIYIIQKATVEVANSKFTNVPNNKYCLVFQDETMFTRVEEDNSIPVED